MHNFDVDVDRLIEISEQLANPEPPTDPFSLDPVAVRQELDRLLAEYRTDAETLSQIHTMMERTRNRIEVLVMLVGGSYKHDDYVCAFSKPRLSVSYDKAALDDLINELRTSGDPELATRIEGARSEKEVAGTLVMRKTVL